jgi:hypothetical protein
LGKAKISKFQNYSMAFIAEKLLHYEELYLTMEQERPRQEENIKKLTGKCSYKIKLYNNIFI